MFRDHSCIPRKICTTIPTMKQQLLSVCGYQKKELSGHAQSCEDGTIDEPSEAQIRDEIELVQEAMLRVLTRFNAMGLGVQAQQTLLRGVLQRADGSITSRSTSCVSPRAREQISRRKSDLRICSDAIAYCRNTYCRNSYCDSRSSKNNEAARITKH